MARFIFCLFSIVLFCSACQGSNETIIRRLARFGEDNRYYVYTRDNSRSGVRVEPTIASANLQIRVQRTKTVIVIHDLKGSFATSLNPTVKDALLTAEDVNVIIVDWRSAANMDPFVAEVGLEVGAGIANLIRILVNTRKASLENLHLVGFGVGAHVAAFAARAITTGKIARITALNPARDLGSGISERLRPSDADYVEVIHTESNNIGILEAIGHVDFFPNGGLTQEGCGSTNNQCHHDRSWEMFAGSLTHGTLEGNKCPNAISETTCKGFILKMGNNQLIKYGEGSYYVETSDKYPYHK